MNTQLAETHPLEIAGCIAVTAKAVIEAAKGESQLPGSSNTTARNAVMVVEGARTLLTHEICEDTVSSVITSYASMTEVEQVGLQAFWSNVDRHVVDTVSGALNNMGNAEIERLEQLSGGMIDFGGSNNQD